MISKTKIAKRVGRKTDRMVVETILLAKKSEKWRGVAQALSGAKRDYSSVNLKRIDSETKEGDTVVVLGKVLGVGNLTKKVRVCAMSFSESAVEKLKAHKSEMISVLDEIKKNPKMEGVKILR
jgi:large subunit ribosomal protein L18e